MASAYAAAAALKRPTAIAAVCAVLLVLSSLRQPATAMTNCSDCPTTCNNQVTTNCAGIKSSAMTQCMGACGGTFDQCSTSCSNAADSSYNSCKSTVYLRCMDTCNSNCTTTDP